MVQLLKCYFELGVIKPEHHNRADIRRQKRGNDITYQWFKRKRLDL